MTNASKAHAARRAVLEPDFSTEAEAADWYNEHDLSGIPVEEVEQPPRGALVTVAVRLPAAEIQELKRRAARLGIGYTTYLRMLVNRHILEEKPIG